MLLKCDCCQKLHVLTFDQQLSTLWPCSEVGRKHFVLTGRKLKYSVRKLVIIRKMFSKVLEQKLYIQYGRSHYSVRFEFYTNNFFLVYRINTLRCSVFFLVTLYNLMPQEKFIYFIFVYMVYVFDQESIQSYFNLCSYRHKDQIYKKSLYLLLRLYW